VVSALGAIAGGKGVGALTTGTGIRGTRICANSRRVSAAAGVGGTGAFGSFESGTAGTDTSGRLSFGGTGVGAEAVEASSRGTRIRANCCCASVTDGAGGTGDFGSSTTRTGGANPAGRVSFGGSGVGAATTGTIRGTRICANCCRISSTDGAGGTTGGIHATMFGIGTSAGSRNCGASGCTIVCRELSGCGGREMIRSVG
jgi:hypothetical protein